MSSREVRDFASTGVGLTHASCTHSAGEARILRLHANKGRSLVWTRAFFLLLGFNLLSVPDYVGTRAVVASLRLGLRKAELSRGLTASCQVLTLLVLRLVLGGVLGRVPERIEPTLKLSRTLFQDLDLHGVPLSLGQSQLLLSPLAFLLLAQRWQAVEETVIVVDERHGNLRLGFVRPDVDIVARKHLVVSIDKV